MIMEMIRKFFKSEKRLDESLSVHLWEKLMT